MAVLRRGLTPIPSPIALPSPGRGAPPPAFSPPLPVGWECDGRGGQGGEELAGGLLRRGSRAFVLVLLLTAVTAGFAVTAPAAEVSEYDLKAAFLYNFVRFVDWPQDAFAGERTPLTICVLGEDPFGPSLDAVVRGEQVGERGMVIQRTGGLDDLGACHVLFVSRSERKRLAKVLARVQGQPVLTVADMEGFLRAGGVINFVQEDSRIRFLINTEAAERGGLRISSKLLRLAMAGSDR